MYSFPIKNAVIRSVLSQEYQGKKEDIVFVEDIKIEYQDFKDKSKVVLGVARMKTEIENLSPGLYDIQVVSGVYLSKKNEAIQYLTIVKATAVVGVKK